jgi:hypothetical protein
MSKARDKVAMTVIPIKKMGTVMKNFHLKAGVRRGVRLASFSSSALHSASVGTRPFEANLRLFSGPRSMLSRISDCRGILSSNRNFLSFFDYVELLSEALI